MYKWIYCDIDGTGKKWRLTVSRVHEDWDDDGENVDEYDTLYFIAEDFEDAAEHYADYPQAEVQMPENP